MGHQHQGKAGRAAADRLKLRKTGLAKRWSLLRLTFEGGAGHPARFFGEGTAPTGEEGTTQRTGGDLARGRAPRGGKTDRRWADPTNADPQRTHGPADGGERSRQNGKKAVGRRCRRGGAPPRQAPDGRYVEGKGWGKRAGRPATPAIRGRRYLWPGDLDFGGIA